MEGLDIIEVGDFTVGVPAAADVVRGLIVALGGPDTRAFVTGGRFGAPLPELESALGVLAADLRRLAAEQRLALVGTSLAAMADGPESDRLVFEAIERAAVSSGRPEIATAPWLLYGISGGTPLAAGLVGRHPERVAGYLAKVGLAPSEGSSEMLRVPVLVVLGELDRIMDNAPVLATVEDRRSAGALWGVAVEPGMPHHSLTPAHHRMTVDWMRAIAELRLPREGSGTPREVDETSGWLGDRATGDAAPWADFTRDRSLASWLPSREAAESWEALVATDE